MEGFDNLNLRLAFQHRMNGNYKQAKKHLLKAVAENDGQAMYVLAQAYQTGGFGIKEEHSKYDELYHKSSMAGCLWGSAIMLDDNIKKIPESNDIYAKALLKLSQEKSDISDPDTIQLLIENSDNVLICEILAFSTDLDFETELFYRRKLASFGDGLAQWYSSHPGSIVKAADQRVSSALRAIVDSYYTTEDYEKAMYYALKYETYYSPVFRILKEHPNKKLQFMYGRKVSKLESTHSGAELKIYQNTIQMCRCAALCFVFFMRPILSRDIAVLIGKLVYASKNDPDLWDAKIHRYPTRRNGGSVKKIKN